MNDMQNVAEIGQIYSGPSERNLPLFGTGGWPGCF